MHTEVKTNKFYGLDHLRALAILLVFLYHYQTAVFAHPEWVIAYGKFGWTGVDLFFVLSGYLISSQLFLQVKQTGTIAYKEFLLKRFFRILPVFWVTLAIYFCIPAFHEREQLSAWWRYLTFTQNFGLDNRNFGTFSHVWSLCVEEHFYFVFPILLMGLLYARSFNKSWWLLALLFLTGFFTRNYCWYNQYIPVINEEFSGRFWYQYIYYPTYTRLDALLAGVSVAALHRFLPNVFARISQFGNLLVIISLGILTGAYFLCYEEHSYHASVFGFPLVAIGYGIMVMGAISHTSFLYKWNSKITTLIATLSYSLYLLHKGIIHVMQTQLTTIDAYSNTMFFICIAFCLSGAWLLNNIIEKPFMRMREKMLQRT